MGDSFLLYLKDIPSNILSTLTKEFTKLNTLNETEKNSLNTMQFPGQSKKDLLTNKKDNSISL